MACVSKCFIGPFSGFVQSAVAARESEADAKHRANLGNTLTRLAEFGVSEQIFNTMAAAEFKRVDTDGSNHVNKQELTVAFAVFSVA